MQWTGSYGHHQKFERSIFLNFPIADVPKFPSNWILKTQFDHTAIRLFGTGSRWPELVGWRLLEDELNTHPKYLFNSLPNEVIVYYLPAYLLFGSFLLISELEWPIDLSNSFFLSSIFENVVDKDILDEFELSGDYKYSDTLYKFLNIGQRSCIGAFLELFLKSHPEVFSGESRSLYENNMAIWLANKPANPRGTIRL